MAQSPRGQRRTRPAHHAHAGAAARRARRPSRSSAWRKSTVTATRVVTNDGFTANFRQVRGVAQLHQQHTEESRCRPRSCRVTSITGARRPGRRHRFRNLTVKLDQQLTRDLFAQLSFFDSKTDAGATFPRWRTRFIVDANATLPNADGTPGTTPNPYAGRFYMEENWAYRTHNEADRVYRGTLAYQFAPEKFAWIGKHRIAGLVERHESTVTRTVCSRCGTSGRPCRWQRARRSRRRMGSTSQIPRPPTIGCGAEIILPKGATTRTLPVTPRPGRRRRSMGCAQTEVGASQCRSGQSPADDGQRRWSPRKAPSGRSASTHARTPCGADRRQTGDRCPRHLEHGMPKAILSCGTFEGTLPRRLFRRRRGPSAWCITCCRGRACSITTRPTPTARISAATCFRCGPIGPPRQGQGDDVGFALELFDRKLYLRAARFTNQAENGPGTFEVDVDLANPNAALWDTIEMVQNEAIAAGSDQRQPSRRSSLVRPSRAIACVAWMATCSTRPRKGTSSR